MKIASDRKMDFDILCAINEIKDPELGIGIVDVGLIYRAEWTETGIEVDFTTTVPTCPFAALIRQLVDRMLRDRFGETSSIVVRFVADPPWSLDRLSEKARSSFGWGRPGLSPQPFALRRWSRESRSKQHSRPTLN
jgi:metal-sulfur cluster biosynthetic enzyme